MILEKYDNRLQGNTIKLTDFYNGVPRYFNKTIFKKSSKSGKIKLGKIGKSPVLWIVPTNEFNIIKNHMGTSMQDIEGRLDFIEGKALKEIAGGKEVPKYDEILSVEEVKKINALISKLFNRYDIKNSLISLYDGEIIVYARNDNDDAKAIKLTQVFKKDIEFNFLYPDFKRIVKGALFVSKNGEFWGNEEISVALNMGNRFPKEENSQELIVTEEVKKIFKKTIPKIALTHPKNELNFLSIIVSNGEMSLYATDTVSLIASNKIKTSLKDGEYLLSKSILLSTPDKIRIGDYGSFAYFKNYQLWANSPDRFNLPKFDRVIPQSKKQIQINAKEILLKLENIDSDEVNLTELGIDYNATIEVQRLKDSLSDTKGDISLYGEGSSSLPIAIKDDSSTIVIMPIVQPKIVEENTKIPLNKKMHLSDDFSVIATGSYGTNSYILDILKNNEKFVTLNESMTYNPINYLNSSNFVSILKNEYKSHIKEKQDEEDELKERIDTIGKDGVDFIDSLPPRQRTKAEELLSKDIRTDDGIENISLFIKNLIDDGGSPKEYNYERYSQRLGKRVPAKDYGISIPNTDNYQVLQYKIYFNYANYLFNKSSKTTMDSIFTWNKPTKGFTSLFNLKNIKMKTPTKKEAKSGEYDKPKISIAGQIISIENIAGSTRSGISEDGEKWKTKMKDHYGYFETTMANDCDEIDVFINSEISEAELEKMPIFAIHQLKTSSNVDDSIKEQFDEHKLILGAKNSLEAERIYLRNYEKGWDNYSEIEEIENLDRWLKKESKKHTECKK